MSEILIKSSVSESSNGAIGKPIAATTKIVTLAAPAYDRSILIKKELPFKNFDEKYSYVRIEAPEAIEVIFDGKSFTAPYFEIVVAQPKSLTIKYHGDTEVMVNVILGV